MDLDIYIYIYIYIYTAVCVPHLYKTSEGGQMSRAPTSHSTILKVTGSNPDLTFSNPGRVKQMTLKLILVTS